MKKLVFHIVLIISLTLTMNIVTGQVYLDVPETIQEHSMWCWDASSNCILTYYGYEFTQCEIADWTWSRSDCCGEPTFDWNHECDKGNYLHGFTDHDCDAILNHFGSILSTGSESELTLEEVKATITSGKPFIFRWDWDGGGAHALVGHGFDGDVVAYMNPWPGDGFGFGDYDWMVDGATHEWTRTLSLTSVPYDFLIQNAEVEQSCVGPGAQINMSCNQCYRGSQLNADMDDVDVGYYLSENTSFNLGTDIYLGNDVSGLGTDDPCNLETANLVIPGGTAAGMYYVLFVADYDDHFPDEINDANNIASVQLQIDDVYPTLTCSSNEESPSNSGLCTYTIEGPEFDATVTDNGTVETLSWVLSGETTGSGDNTMEGTVLNFGINTVIWTATDECGNESECSYTVTVIDEEPPTMTCLDNQTLSTDEGKCFYTVQGSEFDPTNMDDNCGSWELTNDYNGLATLNGEQIPFGEHTIIWTLSDDSDNETTCTQIINVNEVITVTEVTVEPNVQQYSDLVTFTATVVPWECDGAGTAAEGVNFYIDLQFMGYAPLVDGVAVLEDVALLDPDFIPDCFIEAVMAPGIKTVEASFVNVNDDFNINNPSTDLEITPEDIYVEYTGTAIAATKSVKDGAFEITLRAVVIDRNEYNGDDDDNTGDVRNARVKFVVANYGESDWLCVNLIDPMDLTVGMVEWDIEGDIGNSNEETLDVDIFVEGYYEGISADNPVIVYRALGDFITGGGNMTTENAAGMYATSPDSRLNFGFNVKILKNGKTLQGKMNIIYRIFDGEELEAIYQVKSNAITSLGTNFLEDGSAIAEFVSKANLTDITDPNYPVSISGNLTLHVTMTDFGEPGNDDKIAFSLYNGKPDPELPEIGLMFSSNWMTLRTEEQVIDGGNLVVHSGASFDPDDLNDIVKVPKGKKKSAFIPVDVGNSFNVYPNPFSDRLFFEFSREESTNVTLALFDATGRKLSVLFNQRIEGKQIYRIEYKPKNHVSQMLIYRMSMGDHFIHGKLLYER